MKTYEEMLVEFHTKYSHWIHQDHGDPPEEMLVEFHTKYSHWIHQDHGDPPEAVRFLRLRLITEELGELGEEVARKEPDQVLIADALADLGYVLVGTAVSCGLSFSLNWRSLEPKDRSEEIRLINMVRGNAMHLMAAENGKVAVALHQNDVLKQVEAVMNLFQLVYGVALIYNFPYYEIFAEVHRSNCTKRVVEGQDPAAGLKYGKKTTKGPGYQPPNLAPLLKLKP